MQSLIKQFTDPSSYRLACAVLLIAGYGLPIGIAQLGGPDWLGFVVGAPACILLIFLTYHRLRDAALSDAWVCLMIITFNVGPSWDVPGPITFSLGNLINFVPIALALTIPTNAGGNPKTV